MITIIRQLGGIIPTVFGEGFIKHWINSKEICFYTRYVVDILIIFDANRTTEKEIAHWFNGIDTNKKFKLTVENNGCVSFLDLNIQRKPDRIELGVYRKETNTDITIHKNSNHPQEHRNAAYRFYINRLSTLPITQTEKDKEWNVILNRAHNNGFSTEDINKLKKAYCHN